MPTTRVPEPALRVAGVWKAYMAGSAPVRALRGVDLVVERGEFVAVTGPSGCGKSTLLHLVAGLDLPDEGIIEVAGERVDQLSASRAAVLRRRHVGLVFQFFELLESMTAAENVTLAALLGGLSRRAAERRAAGLLDMLGLLDRAGERPGALAGGQRQRLAIARALANSPTLLLADEPTGALDTAGAAEITELLQRLHQDGQTIVLVTHDPDVARAADRLVLMRDGHLVTSGRPDLDRGGAKPGGALSPGSAVLG